MCVDKISHRSRMRFDCYAADWAYADCSLYSEFTTPAAPPNYRCRVLEKEGHNAVSYNNNAIYCSSKDRRDRWRFMNQIANVQMHINSYKLHTLQATPSLFLHRTTSIVVTRTHLATPKRVTSLASTLTREPLGSAYRAREQISKTNRARTTHPPASIAHSLATVINIVTPKCTGQHEVD